MANHGAARAWRTVSPPTGVPCAPRALSDHAEGRRRGESWVGVPESRTDPETASRSQQVAPPDSRLCDHERSRVSSSFGGRFGTTSRTTALVTRCWGSRCGRAAVANHERRAGRWRIMRPPVAVHASAPRCLSDHAERAADVANDGSASRIRTTDDAPNRRSTRLAGGPRDRSRVSSTR